MTRLAKPTHGLTTEYKRHLDIMYLLQTLMAKGNTLSQVTVDEIHKYVNSPKKGKAPDIFGVATEHVMMAPDPIIHILCHLTNIALKTGKLPDECRLGSITTILKTPKPHRNPNNYQHITITFIIGKIVEKHMISYANPILDPAQSHLQFGLSPGCSPLFAELIITEILTKAKDNKDPLYINFLNTSKAFYSTTRVCSMPCMHGIYRTLCGHCLMPCIQTSSQLSSGKERSQGHLVTSMVSDKVDNL